MRLKLRKATGLNFYRGSFVAKPVRIRSHGAFNVVSQGFVVRRQVHFDVATWRPQNDDSYVGLGGAHYHYAFLSFDFSRSRGPAPRMYDVIEHLRGHLVGQSCCKLKTVRDRFKDPSIKIAHL